MLPQDLTFDVNSIQDLFDGSAFPHEVGDIQILETHISWIILTGPFAYKLKKSVKFDFVDYSTLNRRKHFCEEEVKLNRRYASEVYLGVVPVFRTEKGIRFGDEHESVAGRESTTIEHAVKMHQFPHDSIFANQLQSPDSTCADVEHFGKDIGKFHAAIELAPPTLPVVQPKRMFQDARDNFTSLATNFATHEKLTQIDELAKWTSSQFVQLADLMLQRLKSGKVRRCHGDLHTKNIIKLDNRLVPFDGIEFNEALQWNDLVSEIAFPVVDLISRGRSDLGWRLFNGWLEFTGDYGSLPLLRYYLVYRAMVRAKVTALNPKNRLAERCDNDSKEHNPFAAEAGPWDKYFRAARQIAFTIKPFLWITHGLSGSGKTTKANRVVEKLGGIRIRSDVERHRLAKSLDISSEYAAPMNENVYLHLKEMARLGIKSEIPTIVDATFLQRKRRDEFKRLARELDVPFGILHCQETIDELKKRIKNRRDDASEATCRVLEEQLGNQEPLELDEKRLVIFDNVWQSKKRRQKTNR